ncbi:MAG: hypothetical protein HY644_06310 [Acidobacteria bacterium]|nr:hypothetical protein [Acidobacteriota bacterium]
MAVILNQIITLLALLGFVISSYFTAIAYRWIDPKAGYLPGFCRMGEKTCASVIFTPRARLFGVPNSALGQVYYLALLAGLWTQWFGRAPFFWLALAASVLTVFVGMYLTYSLLFWTKIPCKLCFASHGINAAILVLLLAQAGTSK